MQRLLATVCARVRRTIELHEMMRPGERVLVAVSGGADSVGLLAIMSRLGRRLGVELVAAHVNHALRGADSDADEAAAAAAAAKLGLPFVRSSLAGKLARRANLEERARELRYAALFRLARDNDCVRIATGHTQDDQAETLLLRLIRGSGPSGLASIRPRRADGVVRPLIDCRRTDVERVVRSLGLEHRHDRSNDDPRHLRNRLRARIVPLLVELNPNLVPALARTAMLERMDAELIDGWLDAHAEEPAEREALDVAALTALPEALRPRLAARWLARRGVAPRSLTARHLDAVLGLASRVAPSGSIRLPGAKRLVRHGGSLRLEPFTDPTLPAVLHLRPIVYGAEVSWHGGWRLQSVVRKRRSNERMPADLWTAVCDVDAIGGPLVIRPPRRGERARPLGLGGSRKLSDVFIDRRVPSGERAAYPVVACGDEIVWVPGVLRSESFRVGPDTRRTVWLSAERAHG